MVLGTTQTAANDALQRRGKDVKDLAYKAGQLKEAWFLQSERKEVLQKVWEGKEGMS